MLFWDDLRNSSTHFHVNASFPYPLKLSDLQACSFIKKWLQHSCFPVKFAQFLTTPISKNIANDCFWLLRILDSRNIDMKWAKEDEQKRKRKREVSLTELMTFEVTVLKQIYRFTSVPLIRMTSIPTVSTSSLAKQNKSII